MLQPDGHCPYVGEIHMTSKLKAIFVIIGGLSIIAAVFICSTIFSIKKLRVHPSVMIGYISLFEGIWWFHSIVWAISTMEFIDYFGLQYLLKYTIAFNLSTTDSCNTLWQINQIVGYQFFQVMSLGMNIWLWVDLVLTLKEPFYPAKRRLKFYLLFSFIMALTSSLASIRKSSETCLSPDNAGKSSTQNTIFAISLSIYILISMFSVIYAARMLSRPGMSSDIRTMFMKKHMFYALSFIIIWSLMLLNAYDQLYNHYDSNPQELKLRSEQGYSLSTVRFPNGFFQKVWVKDGDKKYMDLNTYQIISFISSISTGFIMGLIRLMEPYFLFLLKTFFKSVYGIPLENEEEDKKNSKLSDTITAYLNSSLNIELVHIILKAITQEWTKTTIPSWDWKSFVPMDSDFDQWRK